MKILRVIESLGWINIVTGHTASVYGAVPYTTQADKPNWKIERLGYTWELDNGTIGLGRMPMATLKEAQDFMDKYNAKQEEYSQAYWNAMRATE